MAAALSSAKYSNSVRPALAFDAADASLDRSTSNSACFTSLRRLPIGSPVCALLCVIVAPFLGIALFPLEIPLLQPAGVALTLRHAAQCKFTALFAAMLCNGIAYATIDNAAFQLRLCHCGTPRRVTATACFHLFSLFSYFLIDALCIM
jgi:hypothetical protein